MATPSFGEQERALRQAYGAHRRQLDLVTVEGPDAASFLDGQVSQAVASMAEGEARWSFVLHPQGKVVALVRVVRRSADQFELWADGNAGTAVAERLKRFLLRVKADISSRTVDVVSVRGPEAVRSPDAPGAVPSLWPNWPGYDLVADDGVPEGAMSCGTEAWHAARIAAGLPENGRELNEKTIPAESGMVDLAANFTKGCYVGQELVARIDSRGHVNRLLRRLTVESGPVPAAGAELFAKDPGKAVGAVTSSAPSSLSGSGVALAYVRREVGADEALIAQVDGTEVRLVA